MAAKTLGIITLLLTAYYFSYNRHKSEAIHYGLLLELCSLFSYIQKNIDCFTKPLNEICCEYTSPLLQQYGFFTAWKQQDLTYAVNILPHMTTPVKEILLSYSHSAGQGYKEEELQLCRFTYEQLQEIVSGQKEEHAAKNKMYRTLPYLLALSIVLLLY